MVMGAIINIELPNLVILNRDLTNRELTYAKNRMLYIDQIIALLVN